METSTLRWIIIVIGLLILASIFLFGNPEKKRKPSASRRKDKTANERREPTLDDQPEYDTGFQERFGEAEPDRLQSEPDQGELLVDPPAPAPDAAPPPPRKPAGPPPEKIKSLFLMARDNHLINGAELLQATIKTGMEFGDMNIFHRIDDRTEQPVFSMANAAKPGHFDRAAWNTFETSGVVLFLTLPGPVPGLDAWDSLYATARRMSEILHTDLMDDDHNPFSRLKEAQVREEMREYDRSKS
jgi:cell division protein ZipA